MLPLDGLPLDGNRHLQFEMLELRTMLAGDVLVSVVDGDLRVTGDDQDNVLEVQQLFSSDPRAVRGGVSFQITPDADTSINRKGAGVGIVVSGVTRDVAIDMRDGRDELTVLGANGRQIRDLLIDTGSGPDAVSITRFSLSRDLRVSDADSLDLSLHQTKSGDVFIKIDDIEGESKRTATPTSSVTIRDSRLDGGANISSGAPLAVKIHGTFAFPDVCKTPAPPAPLPPCGTVHVSSGAPLSLDMDQTRAAGVFIKVDDIKGEAKGAVAAPMSSITIRNSRLREDVNISSNSPLALTMDQTKAKGDVLIKAEGISLSSDVRSSKFANSIRIVDSVFGSLGIVGSERRDELDFERLHILGRTRIETGSGDDSLTVSDTLFGGFAFFDGGDDTDSLILKGTRFRHGSKVVNWE